MKNLVIFFLLLLLTSCGFSYSKRFDFKSKTKTVDGKRYTLIANTNCTLKQIFVNNEIIIQSNVQFITPKDTSSILVETPAFMKHIKLKNITTIGVEEVDFDVNPTQDTVCVYYTMKMDQTLQVATIDLIKHTDHWKVK